MQHKGSERTLVTLANAGELAAMIAQRVMGNDIADSFNGSPLTRTVLHNLAQTKFQSAMSKHLGAN